MEGAQEKVALLAGASGLVGGYALSALLDAPEVRRVVALTRRPLPHEHPRLANRIVRFAQLEAQLKGTVCDVALCCLGTTRRQAGSSEQFREVDLTAVLDFARAALAAGAKRFVVVSSVGADPAAKNFYLRTKGEMEQGLIAQGFASLDILQPSLLIGWRGELMVGAVRSGRKGLQRYTYEGIEALARLGGSRRRAPAPPPAQARVR
jgi:uncharacterized protein YbjT (DUF2867 family)